MKAKTKTTAKTSRGKSKTQKAKPTRKTVAPKPKEKKLVRKKMDTAQSQIENIVERAGDGFVAFDADMNYTYVNARGGELLGRKPADLIGKNYWTEYPEAKGSAFVNACLRALKEQTPLVIEDYSQPWDRWFENRIHPSKDGLAIFFSEISERKLAEAALRDSEEKYRLLIEHSGEAILLTNPDGSIYSANPEACRIFGGSEEELRNLGRIGVVDINDPRLPAALEERKRTGKFKGELNLVRKDGTIFPVDISTTIFKDSHGIERTSMVIRDITERNQAEEALRAREESYANLLKNLNGAAYRSRNDPDWTLEYISEGCAALTGYRPDELIESRVTKLGALMHPEDAGPVWEKCQISLAAHKACRNEYLITHRNGETRWVWDQAQGVYSETGELLLIEGLLTDITESKQAERQLRQANERFRAFSETTIEGLSFHDNGVILDVNPALRRMFGYPSDSEIIGRNILEFLAPHVHEEVMRRVTSRDLRPYESLGVRKDGSIFPIEVHPDSYTHEGREIRISSIQDITQRKRAEEALRESEERFRTLWESTVEGIVIHEHGIILEVNRAMLQLFGVTREQAVGRSLLEFAPPENRALLREKIESQTLEPYQTSIVSANGTRLIIEVNRKSASLQGRSVRIVSIRDITERKRAEDELRLSRDRLADLSRRLVEVHEAEQRAIGRELHDQIGQMLTALKLTLEIATQLPPQDAQKKFAQAQELVTDLLARVSGLSLELRPPMLDDLGLVPALLWHVNRYQEQSGTMVEFKHSGVEGIRFAAQIESTAYRVVQEALTNVARHAHATRVGLEVRVVNRQLEIRIEDDGVGFETQAALDQHRGLSGMGERTLLVDGAFRVESEAGKGTRLFIQLPLNRESG